MTRVLLVTYMRKNRFKSERLKERKDNNDEIGRCEWDVNVDDKIVITNYKSQRQDSDHKNTVLTIL